MINRLLCSAFLGFCFVTAAVGQSTTSVGGTVADATGALVLDSTVTLVNNGTSATRTDHTNPQGHYEFSQVPPGTYTISATATGFGKAVANNVQLVVSTPATVNLTFTTAGANVTVDVTSTAAQVNTSDATLGSAITTRPIEQLPVEGHDVTSLLALQPGVTFISSPNLGVLNDPRSGSVNGGKSDQANVLLDGVDSNDQLNRTSFTSVLRVTPDSVQEFRTITSNPGADLGFASGAQVTIVTKSGANAFHGLAYEYNRNTSLEANLFLNKTRFPIVARPALIRNVFGGAFSGPIVKDKIFFFVSYEGRRDASAQTQNRIVPTTLFSQGTFTYVPTTGGGTDTLSAQQVAAADPGGPMGVKGEDPNVLATFKLYPAPNGIGGDSLNTGEYSFNAKEPLKYDTYFARFDYNIDRAGKHSIFWRGNYQLDNYADGAPEFPGQPASSIYVSFSKGDEFGYNWIITPTLVNTAHFGFTRQSVGRTGTQTHAASIFDAISPLYPVDSATSTQAGGTATANQLPVYDIRDDAIWNKGRHTIGFGGEVFILHNHLETDSYSFSEANMDALFLQEDGGVLIPAYAQNANNETNFERQMGNLLGIQASLNRRSNYDLSGNTLGEGAPVVRDFVQKHFDLYFQDSWKVLPNLTLTAGLRYTANPAVYEAQGYNVSSTQPLGDWFAKRGQLAAQGLSDSGAGLVTYNLSTKDGIPFYAFHNDFQPRVSFAYSPGGGSGIMHALTGGAGKSSIRGGFGLYYDAFGQALAQSFSSAAGFSTETGDEPNQPVSIVPRYTGFYNPPFMDPLFPASPPGGFPQTPAVGAFAGLSSADSSLKSPYTMVQNLTIERQLSGGFVVQVSYVGRQSRHSILGEDIGEPTDLVDTASGMDYFTAAKILAQEVHANSGNKTYVSPRIPYWENLWPGAASAGVSATQGIYQQFLANEDDWTSALLPIDTLPCTPSCSKLGPYALWSQQFAGLAVLRSIGMGSYNSLQASVHKAFTHGYQFDVNYTLSHCIDLGSSPEIAGGQGVGNQINNSWDPKQNRAVCDYDLRHQFLVNSVAELPFGKGKRFGGTANALTNALIGGWQITAIFRDTSGFPASVGDNVGYPTLWDNQGYATQSGPLPKGKGPKGQMFRNPAAAYAAFAPTFAGESGTRNDLRGDGLITLDLGMDKTWQLFSVHGRPNDLQFRIEGFNITNTARFDPSISNASLQEGISATFGQYEGPNQLVDPRVFQAVLRYTF
jgi:Carboxypeptidase regulatory-like domain